MDERVLAVFVREVERQGAFALRAFDQLERSLGSPDQEEIWFAVQGFLVAVGNISKLLWPTRERIPGRGEALRETLDIPHDSLLSPRTFRNHFEHFDERLETWVENRGTSSLVDSNLLPPGLITGLPEEAFLRNLDPTTLALTYRGDRYELREVAEAVRDLQSRVARRLRRRS